MLSSTCNYCIPMNYRIACRNNVLVMYCVALLAQFRRCCTELYQLSYLGLRPNYYYFLSTGGFEKGLAGFEFGASAGKFPVTYTFFTGSRNLIFVSHHRVKLLIAWSSVERSMFVDHQNHMIKHIIILIITQLNHLETKTAALNFFGIVLGL